MPPASEAQVRTLIVDDDFMVARVHRGLVERVQGFVVVGEARTGAEALSMVDDLTPDLVLLDIYLPDMSGLDVLRALRGPEIGAEHPEVDVLVITAARDTETVRHTLRGGAFQYLIKPFESSELTDRLTAYRERLQELRGIGPADQEAIDRAFAAGSTGPTTQRTTMPKGMSVQTADLVEGALREQAQGDPETVDLSATECAEATGVSRVSARRYLEYFAETGQAEVRLRYGTAGRPERRYRWIA